MSGARGAVALSTLLCLCAVAAYWRRGPQWVGGGEGAVVAACVTGAARGLANPGYLAHLAAALAPLEADVFVVASLTELRRGQPPSAAELERGVREGLGPRVAHVSLEGEPEAGEPVGGGDACLTAGYLQATRLRRCFREVQREEARRGRRYGGVLRVRTDLEFAVRLPALRSRSVQLALRHGVVLDHVLSSDSVLPAAKAPFIGDWLTLLPREHAEGYFVGVAEAFDACVPPEAPPELSGFCSGGARWSWAECRFEVALASRGLNVSGFPEPADGTCGAHWNGQCNKLGILRQAWDTPEGAPHFSRLTRQRIGAESTYDDLDAPLLTDTLPPAPAAEEATGV